MTAVLPALDERRAEHHARPGPFGRLAGVAFRRRGRVLLGWLAALAIAFGLSAAFGDEFAADDTAPGSDSQLAQDLLADRFPARAGAMVDVVVRADGPARSPRGGDPAGDVRLGGGR